MCGMKKALCIDKTSRTLRLVVKGKVKVISTPQYNAVSFISFNTQMKPFDNVKVRQALSNVVQREERGAEAFDFYLARRAAPIGYIDARTTILVPQEKGYTTEPGPGEILFDFPALCRDPAFINAVSHIRQIAFVVIRQNRRLLEDYRAMVVLLDAELGKAHR